MLNAEIEPPDRSGWRRRVRQAWLDLPPANLADQARLVLHLLRWLVLGTIVGVLAGVSSWGLLEGLDWATRTRLEQPWLLFLLPVAGLAVGAVYHRFGGRSVAGNNLVLDEIHTPSGWIPRRMSALVYSATVITQLFGGSAGREGTAVQMAGSLTDWFSRTIRLEADDRRMMLVAALSGGFGAMFGVPLAGAVFGLEVQSTGRMRYEELLPALTASIVGDGVVRVLGGTHIITPHLTPTVDAALVAKVALAGMLFGVVGIIFIDLTHAIGRVTSAALSWPPARPLLGGLVIIGLALLFGRDYLGLSMPLAADALGGNSIGFEVFALKLLFTAVTIGSGFHGGEITPLFIVGATLGAALARVLGVPVEVLAAVGYVAVFAGAANTPLTCTIMGVELFGAGMVVPISVACVISYIFSSHRSIYGRQRIGDPKGLVFEGTIVDEIRRRHRDR